MSGVDDRRELARLRSRVTATSRVVAFLQERIHEDQERIAKLERAISGAELDVFRPQPSEQG